jgi:hypothetical protein
VNSRTAIRKCVEEMDNDRTSVLERRLFRGLERMRVRIETKSNQDAGTSGDQAGLCYVEDMASQDLSRTDELKERSS